MPFGGLEVMLMIKRTIAALLAVLSVMLMFTACGGEDQSVYVESVANITGMGYSGLNNRYSGIVESGSTLPCRRIRKKR